MPLWLWAAALLPRLALCLLAAKNPSLALRADSASYLTVAHNLARHGAFSAAAAAPFAAEMVRTPGYPLFLAPLETFGSPILPAILLQSLAGAVTLWLAWGWMRRFAGRRAALGAALFLAWDPVTVFHTPLILTEALFNLIIVGAGLLTAWAVSGAGIALAAACGLLWGLSIMVRPIALYLPLLLSWVWWRDRRAWAVFLLCAYLLPAGWTLRNWRLTGCPVYSAVAGEDLLRYPGAGIESLRTGRPWSELDLELRARVDAAFPQGYPNEAVRAQEYGHAAMRIIKANPRLLLRYCLSGAAKLLAGTGLEMALEWRGSNEQTPAKGVFRPNVTGQGTLNLLREHPVLIPFEVLYVAALAALYLLSLLGLWRLWRRGQGPQAVLLGGLIAYFLVLSSSQGYYRFRIPLIPFLAVSAAIGLGRGVPARE